jgi:peptide chain release factor 1
LQRIPPTESKGRRHTSTIGITVLELKKNNFNYNDNDFKIECYCGDGPGGQNRNKNATNVRITHLPTGLQACSNLKSQFQNKQIAMEILLNRIKEKQDDKFNSKLKKEKDKQVKYVQRGTRVRTYDFVNDFVKDERVNKKFATKDIMKGKLEKIYNLIKE